MINEAKRTVLGPCRLWRVSQVETSTPQTDHHILVPFRSPVKRGAVDCLCPARIRRPKSESPAAPIVPRSQMTSFSTSGFRGLSLRGLFWRVHGGGGNGTVSRLLQVPPHSHLPAHVAVTGFRRWPPGVRGYPLLCNQHLSMNRHGESGSRLSQMCLRPSSRGLLLRKRLSANDLCPYPHSTMAFLSGWLARGRLVGALYMASISHVDPIHMGDTSHIQGSHTVATRQVPGVTTGLQGRRLGAARARGSAAPRRSGTGLG